MKILLCFALLLSLFACSDKPATKEITSDFYMPAEWEPHEAVWFGWEDRNPAYYPVIANMIKALSPHVQIKVAAFSDSLVCIAKKTLANQNIDTTQIKFYTMPGERYWIRDHGATFLVNNNNELGVADFDWNLYGYPGWLAVKYDIQKDSIAKALKNMNPATGLVDSLMAVTEKAKIIKANVVIEGGSIEVNGKGTLILCEAVTFQRNPGKTKQELEREFKKGLGVTNIIWLKEGLVDDAHMAKVQMGKYMTFGTGGHTDEFVRFADANTILLAWVEENEIPEHPFNAINHQRMRENLRILEAATDQDGKPFRIIKVPLPGPIEQKIVVKEKLEPTDFDNVTPAWFAVKNAPKVGDTLIRVSASSYLNYLVSNGIVVLPTYVKEGSSAEKEEQVKHIFNKVFPGRKLAWISCMPVNWEGGGLHCSTQQQPRRKL